VGRERLAGFRSGRTRREASQKRPELWAFRATEGSNPALLRLVASGAVRPGRLVKRRIALADVGEALPAMGSDAVEGITVIDRF
jgi:threonine dehydrogenase-like Zn-dependent dehydrogenase